MIVTTDADWRDWNTAIGSERRLSSDLSRPTSSANRPSAASTLRGQQGAGRPSGTGHSSWSRLSHIGFVGSVSHTTDTVKGDDASPAQARHRADQSASQVGEGWLNRTEHERVVQIDPLEGRADGWCSQALDVDRDVSEFGHRSIDYRRQAMGKAHCPSPNADCQWATTHGHTDSP